MSTSAIFFSFFCVFSIVASLLSVRGENIILFEQGASQTSCPQSASNPSSIVYIAPTNVCIDQIPTFATGVSVKFTCNQNTATITTYYDGACSTVEQTYSGSVGQCAMDAGGSTGQGSVPMTFWMCNGVNALPNTTATKFPPAVYRFDLGCSGVGNTNQLLMSSGSVCASNTFSGFTKFTCKNTTTVNVQSFQDSACQTASTTTITTYSVNTCFNDPTTPPAAAPYQSLIVDCGNGIASFLPTTSPTTMSPSSSSPTTSTTTSSSSSPTTPTTRPPSSSSPTTHTSTSPSSSPTTHTSMSPSSSSPTTSTTMSPSSSSPTTPTTTFSSSSPTTPTTTSSSSSPTTPTTPGHANVGAAPPAPTFTAVVVAVLSIVLCRITR